MAVRASATLFKQGRGTSYAGSQAQRSTRRGKRGGLVTFAVIVVRMVHGVELPVAATDDVLPIHAEFVL